MFLFQEACHLYDLYLALGSETVFHAWYGGVTGRPETMCPRANILGPPVLKLIVPCNTMSLD